MNRCLNRILNCGRQSGVSDLPRLRVIDVGAMFLNEAEAAGKAVGRVDM